MATCSGSKKSGGGLANSREHNETDGLIAALVSVAIIAGVTAVGTQLSKTFSDVSTALSSANN